MEQSQSNQLIQMINKIKQIRFNSDFRRSIVGEGQVILLLLEENGLTPGDLAELSTLGSGRIANILKSMEEKGYIVRKKDQHDKRKVLVYVTEKGEKWHKENKKNLEKEINELLDYLGDEDTKELMRIIQRIVLFNEQKEGII